MKRIEEVAIDRSAFYKRRRLWYSFKIRIWKMFPWIQSWVINKKIREYAKYSDTLLTEDTEYKKNEKPDYYDQEYSDREGYL